MARKATGRVIEHESTDGHTYRALRFTAYGRRRYVSLGAVSADDPERVASHDGRRRTRNVGAAGHSGIAAGARADADLSSVRRGVVASQ